MCAPRAFVKSCTGRYSPRVLPGPCYVISDAHLGVATRERELALVRFLEAARRDAGSLVINGDLFDFWFEWRRVMPRAGFRVLAAVASYADAGLPVLWIAGNHDCWGGDLLRNDVGANYLFGPWEGSVAGWAVRVEHGDGLRGVEDRRYRMLRAVLRNPAAIWAYRHILHPDWASRIALGSSAASRTYVARDKGEGLKRVAGEALADAPALDVIIYGHSHVPTLHRTTRGVYANPGTWLTDSTYLRITADAIELLRWDNGRGTPLAREGRPHATDTQPARRD